MAIDTANEKLALIEYGNVFQFGMPISADGLDPADLQQLLWGYPGILWEEIAAIITPSSRTMIISLESRTLEISAESRTLEIEA